MIELIKHFILFYFIFNIIIVAIALIYDYPKELVKERGVGFLIKSLLRLLFFGVVYMLKKLIDNL